MNRADQTILTFNWHEPYLTLLAKTGYSFHIVEPDRGRLGKRKWNFASRPLPDNCSLVTWDHARATLAQQGYALVIGHNIFDASRVSSYHETPLVLLYHNKLSTEITLGGNSVDRELFLADIAPLVSRASRKVAVSTSKQEDWGIADKKSLVIFPGVPVDFSHNTYTGERGDVLRVVNHISDRAIMFGPAIADRILEGFPHSLVGDNPGIATSFHAPSYDELLDRYNTCGVYLHITLAPAEDSYNLAMLEAMAQGAPVVAWRHPHTFLTDGVDGFVVDTVEKARETIASLLADPTLVRTIGATGKQTVNRLFPLDRFIGAWRSVIDDARAHA
jgi:hypothetical protein